MSRLDEVLQGEIKGHLVIDDFHRLDEERKRRVASRIKVTADDERHHAKIIVIGINPVGHTLTNGLPDLAGRFQSIAMDRQPDEKIKELIGKGEQAANIRFLKREEFINEADGSFFTAQRLCYEAALQAHVEATQPQLTDVAVGPLDVLDLIRDALRDKYQSALRAFGSYDHAPPPRGACLILLWLLSRSSSGHVSIEEARLRYPQIEVAFAWLRQSNLSACFEKTPELRSLIYYNRAAAILSIKFGAEELMVETRCREEVNGAWRPDARWLRGPGKDPEPRYRSKLPPLGST